MRGNEVLLVLLGLGALYLYSKSQPAANQFVGPLQPAGSVYQTCMGPDGSTMQVAVPGVCPAGWSAELPPAGVPLSQIPVLVNQTAQETGSLWSTITSIF